MSAGRTGQATGQGGDRPARDPAGTPALERRYLRLLRCYPPSHRAFHREEMLGVLLATARPGQRTPGLGQTVNLAACGLAIRVRRIPGWLAADAGQDALAVVSLIAPAVVFILLALQQAAMNAAASVLGSVLAMVIAIQFGLTTTLACGLGAYLLALLLLPALHSRRA